MAEILTAKNGAVGTITISNPTKMNAMSVQMWTDLPKAIRAFDADPEVRVIVITGVGDKAFVSGADISQFDKLRSSAKTQDDYDNAVADSMVAPVECSKPIIGKIRGFCFGGGLGLAAACDIRICSEDATFRMPAARLGLGYGHKGIKRFTDIIGLANATDIFVTARRFDAPDALRMGFVSRVCAGSEIDAVVDQYTKMIAENAPLTVAASKFNIRQVCAHPDEQDMDRAVQMVKNCFASEDFKEGRTAFMEKRPAQFKGR
ncbi:enoyl-CoA hydratase/isomerase family protein [Alcaligenaceae bacterium LF4-65]|jgi:enoyl-CoA hydratase|uniref:Enoyl-CoA hydratase/isomerase family protein n=1 Tax=Zwartia hollandica TaxID=324606 RepID=A0A953T7R6_9BURK|nr:enoyl-CoA hydratase [Zwartia hollandica]MBZ1350974.1 enoyl-CoA hydratase/isomerase family protein [Zwartia hollandica]